MWLRRGGGWAGGRDRGAARGRRGGGGAPPGAPGGGGAPPPRGGGPPRGRPAPPPPPPPGRGGPPARPRARGGGGGARRGGGGGPREGRGGPPAGPSPGLGPHPGTARRVEVVVPTAEAGTRLDRFLATIPEVGTRSQAKRLIDTAHVWVDGAPRKSAHLLGAGARLEIELPAPERLAAEPEALPLTVLYEDADLLAIDKPPGMVVHPAPGARRGTVVNALVHRLGALAGVGRPDRPRIVHRLDRDTPGVLLVAPTPPAPQAPARPFPAPATRKGDLALG